MNASPQKDITAHSQQENLSLSTSFQSSAEQSKVPRREELMYIYNKDEQNGMVNHIKDFKKNNFQEKTLFFTFPTKI